MDWKHLRETLLNDNHDRPQNVARIEMDLAKVQEGIEDLARLGYIYHLAVGSQPPVKKYPKMFFHFEKAPDGFLCLCEEDREILGDGWFETKSAAEHAEGMGHQFRRGGVFPTKGLPVVVEDENLTPLDRRRKAGLE